MYLPFWLYTASVVGAVALALLMPRDRRNPVGIGAVLGLGTLGGLWLLLFLKLDDFTGFADGSLPFYYVFSAIAIIAAVRVITHKRPVYSALWFVMVVLASAGLFLTLAATFMAVAMVIIYAGAILVTYMFVIMLASQATVDDREENLPIYDRVAKDGILACAAGFVLLAALLSVAFSPMSPNPQAAAASDQAVRETTLAGRSIDAIVDAAPESYQQTRGTAAKQITNTERIGLDLFQSHPLAIELAGVILLVSLVGAVVIAKTRVYEEDEVITGPAAHGELGTGAVTEQGGGQSA